MDFIKRNVLLVAAFALTFIISAVMIIFDVTMYASMDSEQQQLKENIKKIETAEKSNPSPLKENIKSIEDDRAVLVDKLLSVQKMFGKFYQKDLIRFARTTVRLSPEYRQLDRAWKAAKEKNDKKLVETLEARMKELIDTAEFAIVSDFTEYYNSLPDRPAAPGEAAKAGLDNSRDEVLLQGFLKRYYIHPKNDSDDVEIPKSRSKTVAHAPAKNSKGKKKNQPAPAPEPEVKSDSAPAAAALTPEETADRKKVQDALDEFRVSIDKKMLEPVDSANIHEYLLNALGLPRTAAGVPHYKNIIKSIHSKMLGRKIIPGALSLEDVAKFTFYDENNPPGIQRVPLAFRQIDILTNLFLLMKESKVDSLVRIDRTTPLAGRMEGNFQIHSYEFTVIGTVSSLRDFVNRLNDAYRNNVIFIVRDIILTRPNAEDLSAYSSPKSGNEGAGMNSQNNYAERMPGNVNPGYAPERQSGSGTGKDNSGYGAPVAGISRNASAVMKVDCVIFVGDELKRVEGQESK